MSNMTTVNVTMASAADINRFAPRFYAKLLCVLYVLKAFGNSHTVCG